MWTTIRYVMLTAIRDRLFVGLIAGIVGAALIAGVLGHTAFLEQTEMALVFAAGAARMMLAVGLLCLALFGGSPQRAMASGRRQRG